jgi:hypothetical protein
MRAMPFQGDIQWRCIECNLRGSAADSKCTALLPSWQRVAPHRGLKLLTHVDESDAGLGDLANVPSDLPVHLGRLPNLQAAARINPRHSTRGAAVQAKNTNGTGTRSCAMTAQVVQATPGQRSAEVTAS